MSNRTSSIAVCAVILTIGTLVIPLQFSFANTNNPIHHLQAVVGHICDQTMSTINAGGCSSGVSYRAVQNTLPNTDSNSGDASSNYGGICPSPSDRRHCPQAATTP